MRKRTLMHFWWECKLMQPLWNILQRFVKKLKIEPPYDIGITLLDIYFKNTKTLTQRDTCTPMFIATLFTIAKIWKQPKCPSTDEWIKKKWYRGTWVAQSVKHLTSVQVMISWLVSSSPGLGSVLKVQSLEAASGSVSFLSVPPLLVLPLKNKY